MPPCPVCKALPADLLLAMKALQEDDLDAALHAGLTGWCGQAHCPAATGLPALDLQRLQSAREERLRAFAARQRHHARNQRLARRERERAEHRAAPPSAALPGAAALALARAKARANARTPDTRQD
ncbi:MAG: hypothetical protein Q4F49_00855 [Pseudoxanthomonas suwonensis]|nr:hypothetical protein [Pseudoxanthomonas suwonensis]